MKSWVGKEKKRQKNVWTSGILFFNDGDKWIIDHAFIIIGNIPEHYYNYYVNFNSFKIINNEIYYTNRFLQSPNKIDPDKIHLQIRVGETPFSISLFKDTPTYWNIWSISPKNILLKKELTEDKIKIIDLSERFPYLKHNTQILDHPLFRKIQYYGSNKNQALFSHLIL